MEKLSALFEHEVPRPRALVEAAARRASRNAELALWVAAGLGGVLVGLVWIFGGDWSIRVGGSISVAVGLSPVLVPLDLHRRRARRVVFAVAEGGQVREAEVTRVFQVHQRGVRLTRLLVAFADSTGMGRRGAADLPGVVEAAKGERMRVLFLPEHPRAMLLEAPGAAVVFGRVLSEAEAAPRRRVARMVVIAVVCVGWIAGLIALAAR